MCYNGNLVATTNQIPSLSGIQYQVTHIQNQVNVLSTQTAHISNCAPLSGAATVALLAGAIFTGAVTQAGLSLGDNSLNFQNGTTSYDLTTTMLKALVDNSLIWKTTDSSLATCVLIQWCFSY